MIRLTFSILLLAGSGIIGVNSKNNLPKAEPIVKQTPKVNEIDDSEPTFTEREAYLLACLIYSESEGESMDDKRDVASVVINRIQHKDFPNTLEGVIFARNAFSGVYKRSFHVHKGKAWEDCKKAAQDVLENGSKINKNIVYYLNPDKATNIAWFNTLKREFKLYFKNKNHWYYGYYDTAV